MRKKIIVAAIAVAVFALGAFLAIHFGATEMPPGSMSGTSATPPDDDQTDSKPCPWTISKVQLGKWGNGKMKAGTWLKGSFPIPPGVSERPTWYINGTNVGKSQIHFNLRWIPNSSSYINDGMSNTITVKFLKPPYNGASYTYTFTPDFSKIPKGGYKSF
jgi:hypothetical protein